MWELECKEGEYQRINVFRTVVLEKTLENPLDSKEIKSVNPKGNQPWLFIRRLDAKAPILWPPDGKSQFIGKDPDTRKDWGQEEKRAAEDIIGEYHWLKGHEFEQTPEDSGGQGSLACFSHGVAKCQIQLSNWTSAQRTTITSDVIVEHVSYLSLVRANSHAQGLLTSYWSLQSHFNIMREPSSMSHFGIQRIL